MKITIDTRKIGVLLFLIASAIIIALVVFNVLLNEAKDIKLLTSNRKELINSSDNSDGNVVKLRYESYLNSVSMTPKWRISMFFSLVISSLFLIFFLLISNDEIYKGCVFVGIIFLISYIIISGWIGWFDYHIINVTHLGSV